MAEDELAQQREVAQEFCRRHLTQCCEEMLQWSESGVLPSGKVRELAAMCAFAGSHNALNVAEAMVKHEALVRASRPQAAVHGVPTDEVLSKLASGMPAKPWGIGSRRADAVDFARAAVQLADVEAARRLRELAEALDAFDTGGFSDAKVARINAARKAAREYIAAVPAVDGHNVGGPNVVALTEDLWQAIIDWQTASRALEKRREAKELMNADYLDRVSAAEGRIDSLIASLASLSQPAAEAATAPWDDLKVAFGIDDAEKFTTWAAKTRAFYSDGTAGFPKGWELIEMNGAGARCVAVFRVEGAIQPEDGVAVAKLLSKVGGYPYDPAVKQDKSGPSL